MLGIGEVPAIREIKNQNIMSKLSEGLGQIAPSRVDLPCHESATLMCSKSLLDGLPLSGSGQGVLAVQGVHQFAGDVAIDCCLILSKVHGYGHVDLLVQGSAQGHQVPPH